MALPSGYTTKFNLFDDYGDGGYTRGSGAYIADRALQGMSLQDLNALLGSDISQYRVTGGRDRAVENGGNAFRDEFYDLLKQRGFVPGTREVSPYLFYNQLFGPNGQRIGTEQEMRIDPSGDFRSILGVLGAAAAGAAIWGGMGSLGGAAGAGEAAAAAGGLGAAEAAGGLGIVDAGLAGLGEAAAGVGGISAGGGLGGWGAAGGLGAAGGSGLGIVDAGLTGLGEAASGVGGISAGGGLSGWGAAGGAAGGLGASTASAGGWLGDVASTLGLSRGDLIRGGLGLVDSIMGARASDRAADAMVDASREANGLAREMYQQTRTDNLPALEARNAGLTGYRNLLANPTSVANDPGYAWGLQQGTKAVQGSAAARGGLYSGNTLKALTRYGNDYATTKYDNALNRYGNLAGLGGTGAATVANAGQNYATTAGQNITGAGAARGAGIVGGYNALSGGLNNFLNQWQERELMGQYLTRRGP